MATTEKKKRWRRGRPRAARFSQPDVPYTMKLTDGRTVYVEVPGHWTTKDRSGETAFLPQAVALLDQIRALAVKLDRPPSPGYVTAMREALGLTQKEFGERVGVDKLTVSRWERGELRPSTKSLTALEALRREAVRKGVVLAG